MRKSPFIVIILFPPFAAADLYFPFLLLKNLNERKLKEKNEKCMSKFVFRLHQSPSFGLKTFVDGQSYSYSTFYFV
jgi:hypothetical protein